MTKLKIEYETIEYALARDLLCLSPDELEVLIARARKERDRANRIIEWLTAIKFEKRIRDEAAGEDGGME